jgi:putative ABC transport system permease protein
MVSREFLHAARSLRAAPLFTSVTIVTLALGIGATTAIFSLMNSVVLSPLPFRDPGRLAIVQESVLQVRDRYPVLGANARSFDAWRRNCRSACADLTALDTGNKTLTAVGAEPEGLIGALVLPNIFDLLGIPPMLGRGFRAGDDTPASSKVAILGHRLWQRRFGARRDVIGQTIVLDGVAHEVVGVLPPAPRFPRFEQLMWVPGHAGEPEVFTPLVFTEETLRNEGDFDLAVILRLRPGATVQSAEAELTPITRAAFDGTGFDVQPIVWPLIDRISGGARRPLALLLAAGGAALLIVCVNVAGLLTARWLGRRREMAIRTAMGARLADLIRQVAAESAMLALIGGGLGLAAAYAGIGALVAAAPVSIPRLDEVTMDVRVFAFGAILITGCTVLCALVPAWRVWRVDAGELLKGGSHTTTDNARWSRVRSTLVGAEVALTMALLVVAGLLFGSLVRVLQVNPGIVIDRVIALDLELPASSYKGNEDRARFVDRLLSGIEAIADVEAAGITQKLPLEGEASVDVLASVDDPRPMLERPIGNHIVVSPDYFRTMGIGLVRGRLISPADRGRRVAVVSERAARVVWPDRDPIGQHFTRSNRNQRWEVVGVVRDVHLFGLEQQPGPVAYVPHWDRTTPQFSLVVRTKADPTQVTRTLGDAVRQIDPLLPLQRIRTMTAVVDDTVAARRFQMTLTSAFATAGLLVACLGIYAVIAGAVQRRRTELAVRVALGATSRDVTAMVLSQGMRPVLWGLTAGSVAAAFVARAAAGLLFGVSPLDPFVYAAVAALVIAVSAAACLEPALRAARTSPLLALRAQ